MSKISHFLYVYLAHSFLGRAGVDLQLALALGVHAEERLPRGQLPYFDVGALGPREDQQILVGVLVQLAAHFPAVLEGNVVVGLHLGVFEVVHAYALVDLVQLLVQTLLLEDHVL